MKFGLIIFAVLVTQPAPPRAAQNDTYPHQQRVQDSNANQNTTIATGTQAREHPTGAAHEDEQQKKDAHIVIDEGPSKDLWDKAYILATIVLVVVAGLTYGAVRYQARETAEAVKGSKESLDAIRRQASAAEEANVALFKSVQELTRQGSILQRQMEINKEIAEASKQSADAALLNSRALVNSSRPWMLVSIDRVGPRLFHVRFVNYGQTPAEVIGFDYHLQSKKNTDDLSWPPQYADDNTVLENTRMVPPGKEFFIPADMTINLAASFVPDSLSEFEQNSRRAMYWGRLRYRNLVENEASLHSGEKSLGKIHETCWCYFWSPALNDFLITGPAGYNKHT